MKKQKGSCGFLRTVHIYTHWPPIILSSSNAFLWDWQHNLVTKHSVTLGFMRVKFDCYSFTYLIFKSALGIRWALWYLMREIYLLRVRQLVRIRDGAWLLVSGIFIYFPPTHFPLTFCIPPLKSLPLINALEFDACPKFLIAIVGSFYFSLICTMNSHDH